MEVQNNRAFYRNEIKQKNKQIVSICYRNGGNYDGCFVAIQKAIIGEYALNKFNEYYNADTTKRKKSIVNYLALESLMEYNEKLGLIIEEAKNNEVSITKAISSLQQRNELSPILNLQLDENILNKANKKARDLVKNFPKKIVEEIIDEPDWLNSLNESREEEVNLIKQLEKEIYEQYLIEQKQKEEFEKNMAESNYATDDYLDYINKRGDYEEENER